MLGNAVEHFPSLQNNPKEAFNMVSAKIEELYHIGSLLYITNNVSCLAIDAQNHSLTEIPHCHVENCFCQKLGGCLGINIGYDHIYKKCRAFTNINKQIIYDCPFGLTNIIVPIFDGEELVAAFQAGPILTMPRHEYLKKKILPLWNLRPKDQEMLLENLKSYPEGDISYVIALSELITALIDNNENLKKTETTKIEDAPEEPSLSSDRIATIVDFITSNYAEDITLTDAAKYAYVNPSHLSREFNKKMNCNFRSYLNTVRIEKAKELLINTDLSLAEISNQVGFADQSYFNKIFRKQENLTPGQFRTIHANEKNFLNSILPSNHKKD